MSPILRQARLRSRSVAGIGSSNMITGSPVLFGTARPSHPFYHALREAYAHESDPARRATLAAHLDRWRWIPRACSGRAICWSTPRPSKRAYGTGSKWSATGRLSWARPSHRRPFSVQNRPAQAAARGHVPANGRYRQRSGPNNALGRMKLVMPNEFNIYLHDTPSQSLFGQDVRAYSHGCVRVGDALGLATFLLSSKPGWERDQVEAAVANAQTQSIPLHADSRWASILS